MDTFHGEGMGNCIAQAKNCAPAGPQQADNLEDSPMTKLTMAPEPKKATVAPAVHLDEKTSSHEKPADPTVEKGDTSANPSAKQL